jgi:hypothetical protein
VQVSLNGKYNVTGIYNPGSTFYRKAGFDKAGNAYSASLLGTSLTVGDSSFMIRPGNMTNAVRPKGQTVKLPSGNFSRLTLLGASINGSQSGTFTVKYSDGTTQTFTQTMSDWSASAAAPGETLAKSMDSYARYDGSTVQRTTNVYAYSFDLTPGKRVVSVILPTNKDMRILAMDLVA